MWPARRALASLVMAALVGLAIFAWFGHAFLNYDTFYALVWGGDLAHGRTPQYDVPVAPTPHPLAELVGIPVSLLGDAGEGVMLALAGLLRPEAWLFSGVYWLWCAVPLDWRGRARLALLAAAAPVIWCASD